MRQYFYIAPKQAEYHIFLNGILQPAKVRELVEKNIHTSEILGLTRPSKHKTIDTYFPDYVSLTSNEKAAQEVVRRLSYNRTGSYSAEDFLVSRIVVDPNIAKCPEFIPHHIVKKELHPHCLPGEVFFKGTIPKKYFISVGGVHNNSIEW